MKHLLLVSAAMVLSYSVSAQNTMLSNSQTGSAFAVGKISQFTIVSDGTNHTLIAANNSTSKIYAIDLNSATSDGVLDIRTESIDGISNKIASAMGIDEADLTIHNMEIHPSTGAIYVLAHDQNDPQTNWGLFEVRNANEIVAFDFSNVTYSALTFTTNSNTINDFAWGDGNTLYLCNGNFGLDAEVAMVTAPFNHEDTVSNRATSMFKSNWGGSYFTSAPLETISYSQVNGEGRLMGVTTCAPGFSIPTQGLFDSQDLLQVTELFNVNFSPSLKVVTVTKEDSAGGTSSYLFDLHYDWRAGGNQLVRVGERFIDGSAVGRNEYNNDAIEVRMTSGDIDSTLTEEETKEVSRGYKMIAKYDEYNLIAIDETDRLRLMPLEGSQPPTGIGTPEADAVVSAIYNAPANTIRVSYPETWKQAPTYSVYTLSGQQVAHGSVERHATIQTGSYSPGMYVVRISKHNRMVHQQKFVVQ